jgi:hypothetical protein
VKSSKIVSNFSGGISDAGVGDGKPDLTGFSEFLVLNLHDNLSRVGELDCVAQQVDKDLSQSRGIADQRGCEAGRKKDPKRLGDGMMSTPPGPWATTPFQNE